MRKRGTYRPRPVLADPLGFVVESMKPITAHDSYLVDLKLRNHGALTAMLKGSATKREIDDLIAMHNIQEAIRRMIKQRVITDLPIEFDSSTLIRGKCALLELGHRGAQTGNFVCRAQEIQAPNDLMQMHDELMDALKKIVALWDHHCDDHGDGQPSPLHQEARAAITKHQPTAAPAARKS